MIVVNNKLHKLDSLSNIKICISTDSRGASRVNGYTWCEYFATRHVSYHYYYSRINNRYFTTIFDHVDDVTKNGELFDLCILQVGYHEYVVPWTMPVWRSLGFSDDELQQCLTKFPYSHIGARQTINCYNYRNDQKIEQYISILRRYAKKILYIGIPYNWDELSEKTIITNQVFSKYCDDWVELPMDKNFPKLNTPYTDIDRIHYLSHYTSILAHMVWEKAYTLLSPA